MCIASIICFKLFLHAYLHIYIYIGIPKFVNTPRSIVVMSGETGMLSCLAFSIPTPVITWYRLINNNDTMEILPGSYSNVIVDNITLTINDVEYYQDEGYYLCQANNYLQTISAVSFLKVYGKHLQ